MIKRIGESVAQDSSVATAPDQAWVGFVCRDCSAPLALHLSNNGSRPGERSARGWRVTCTSCGTPGFYELGTVMVRITVS